MNKLNSSEGKNDHRKSGRLAEDEAVKYLLGKGYTIVTRRFSSPRGEIDIVAMDGDLLVIVEVKQRTVASPEESVGQTKRLRLKRVAEDYLLKVGLPNQSIRFDLIAMDQKGIRHFEGGLNQIAESSEKQFHLEEEIPWEQDY